MEYAFNARPGEPLIEIPRGDISIRFGTRQIVASSTQSDIWHPNVLFLAIHPTLLNRTVWRILEYTPRRLYDFLKLVYPEWLLPRHIVLKMHKSSRPDPLDSDEAIQGEDKQSKEVDADCDPKGEQGFRTEVSNYQRLSPLQGYRIPEFFGQTVYQDRPAMLVSRFFGQRAIAFDDELGKSPFPRGEEDLYLYLRDAYEDLSKFGVYQDDDDGLNNYIFVEEDGVPRIVVVDLERIADWEPRHIKRFPGLLNSSALGDIGNARFRRFGIWGAPSSLHSRILWTIAEKEFMKGPHVASSTQYWDSPVPEVLADDRTWTPATVPLT